MLFFDITKAGRQGHRSGLTRVSERLRRELGTRAEAVSWESWGRASVRSDDWFFTAELFSEAERPGFWTFLAKKPCRLAALFHDAIPLKRPDITWPQSVARQPEYMKMLASFDLVWAVSAASRDDLLGYWRWLGLEKTPPVEVLGLGSDFDGTPRRTSGEAASPARFLCVGILEPRKNQTLALEAASALWCEGASFELHFVGRVNPHFGKGLAQRIAKLGKEFPGLHFHREADDRTLAGLYEGAYATLFPTIAEGCGLPVLESLWRGVPCLCSDLPVLLENASGGGCLPVATNDVPSWIEALKRILEEPGLRAQLAREAAARPLPTWEKAAATLAARLL